MDEFRKVKGDLTRAENRVNRVVGGAYVQPSNADLEYGLRIVAQARDTFERIGWPDWWSRVDRLAEDIDARMRWPIR
jgi:hypothetical protein